MLIEWVVLDVLMSPVLGSIALYRQVQAGQTPLAQKGEGDRALSGC